jgi:hypothetical protein
MRASYSKDSRSLTPSSRIDRAAPSRTVSLFARRSFRKVSAARAKLAQLGDRLKPRNVSSRAEVLYGNRGAEVVRYARESGTDLILLTAPRFDPQNPAASWGGMSYKFSLFAPCPVLLVK